MRVRGTRRALTSNAGRRAQLQVVALFAHALRNNPESHEPSEHDAPQAHSKHRLEEGGRDESRGDDPRSSAELEQPQDCSSAREHETDELRKALRWARNVTMFAT